MWDSVGTAAARLIVEEAGAARLVGAETVTGGVILAGADVSFDGWEGAGANGLNPFVC